MKVTLVCIGRFHLFDLAREMLKRGMLERIFTGYPMWKLRDEGISPENLCTYPWIQTPYMALAKWNLLGDTHIRQRLAWLAHETMDRYVASHLPASDVLFVLSGSGLRCGRLAQSKGIKYVCDRGSSHIQYQNNILQEEFARWGDRFPGIFPRIMAKEEAEYEAADIVTVPSTFAYRSFIECGVSESKLRLVPYGVNLDRFTKVAEPDPKDFNVLFVGNVSFRKGVPYLLKAFRQFRHPRKRLKFVGSMAPEMRRFLQRQPSPENVEFLGHCPQKELKEIMSRSHVMVLPSIEEGLALVQSQALACACPVIGTYNTGAEDLFSDGVEGFIVPPRDSVIIADKLQLLADDPNLRQRLSEAALKRVKHLGGWQQYGDRMTEIFKSLCK